MIGAFFFLATRSLRNQVLHKLRQSKSPRYLLALVVGVLYFYFLFGRRPHHAAEEPFPLLEVGGHVLVVGALLLGAISMWIMGGESAALAFSQAEASFLFPAPVSRRQLVGYKLVRAQLPLLFNVLIWVFLLQSGASRIPMWAQFVAIWVVFATIHVHRLGASLVRTAWRQHGLTGARRNLLSLGVFAVIVLLVAMSVAHFTGPLRAATDWDARAHVLALALESAPARYALWPFSALVGPVFAEGLRAWALALPGALLVLAVHVWWVMHTDSAFEEAALAATVARAQRLEALRGRRSALFGGKADAAGGASRATAREGRPTSRMPRLAPVGHPVVAILWKNVACLKRAASARQLMSFVIIAAVGGFAIAQTSTPWAGLTVMFLILAGVLLLMGPVSLRGDLRQDLQHLAGLKILPFSGQMLVMAEVLSMAVPLAVMQLVALGIAAGLAHAGGLSWGPPNLRLAIVVGGIPALVVFNCASIAIQNGTVILFPGWSRLGAVVPGGVEMMGQVIVASAFYFLLLAVLLVVPAGAGFAAVGALHITGPLAVVTALLVGAAMLAFELQGVFQLLGHAFEKLEPSSASG